MQDRLKFRFWDTKTENIITMNERLMYTGRNFNLDLGNMIYASKRFVTMQCTGLKDKNGKLIYEGDIVKVPDNWDMFGMMAGEKREVYFKEGGFRLKPNYQGVGIGYWLEDAKEFEIIGNIYQNSELLAS